MPIPDKVLLAGARRARGYVRAPRCTAETARAYRAIIGVEESEITAPNAENEAALRIFQAVQRALGSFTPGTPTDPALRCERYLLHAVTQWLIERCHSEDTLRAYLTSFRWWAMDTGRRRLDLQCAVSHYHITRWLGSVKQVCPSPRSVNLHASAIRSWYGWLASLETRTAKRTLRLIDRSPFDKRRHMARVDPARVYTKAGGRRESLTKPEAQRVIDFALNPATREDIGLALALHVCDGLRRHEIPRVRLEHFQQVVDDGLWLTVHGKGRKTRFIKVEQPTAAALARLVKRLNDRPGRPMQRGLLFGSPRDPSRPVCRDTISAWVESIRSITGRPTISTHDCRRTAATLKRSNGGELLSVSKHLGHSNIELTERCYDTGDRQLHVTTGLEAS